MADDDNITPFNPTSSLRKRGRGGLLLYFGSFLVWARRHRRFAYQSLNDLFETFTGSPRTFKDPIYSHNIKAWIVATIIRMEVERTKKPGPVTSSCCRVGEERYWWATQ
jgi:hypothetical protein